MDVRSLLPNERLESRGRHTVVTDLGADGTRHIKFWVDSGFESFSDEHDPQQMLEADTPMFGEQPSPPEESHQYRSSQAGQIPVFGGLRQHVPGT